METVYTSKIDTWLVLLIVATIVLSLGAAYPVLKNESASAAIGILPVILLGIGLPVWLFTSTRYTLNQQELLIKSGPFRWVVPVDQITSITPTNSPLSSPALSLDRLRIEYSRGAAVMISPKDKARFLSDIENLRAGRREQGPG